ncbi:hypothetical protein V8G54_036198 [Vigna mungo]|uniref:Uncharacterized protein n=1 Tax=Vigna mungo TaxID=3915 RepID=A0AAQ3MGD3_VIGMU
MSILRGICVLRVGVATPKPYLLPSIFSSSFNIHTLSHTTFARTFRFHPPSIPLSSFVPLIPPKAAGGRPRELLVQHLLVKEDDQKLLLDLLQKISSGEDLSDLAVEYSLCPSKEEGGMLGWVKKGQMDTDIITINFLWVGDKGVELSIWLYGSGKEADGVVPEFEEAAFSAPLNKVVKCKTKFGWHLLQVLSESSLAMSDAISQHHSLEEESILQDIQPHELHGKIQDPNFLEAAQLIDVREPEEVAKASLPGFTVLPLRQFGSWGPEITKKLDPEKDIYVMCHHGMRSLQVAKWLLSQGFRKVYNVSGGIHAYAVQVDPSVPTY